VHLVGFIIRMIVLEWVVLGGHIFAWSHGVRTVAFGY